MKVLFKGNKDYIVQIRKGSGTKIPQEETRKKEVNYFNIYFWRLHHLVLNYYLAASI